MTDDYAVRLRDLRNSRRMTQRQLAAEMGRSEMTVWNWEHGKCRPPTTARPRLAQVLGVDELQVTP
jgi:transcriptional regulator with XRE-family HTH domain